jgi:hypothetical protein
MSFYVIPYRIKIQFTVVVRYLYIMEMCDGTVLGKSVGLFSSLCDV